MPKHKTCKALAKRIKITAHGKLMHYGAGKRHLLSSKSRSRKRRLGRSTLLSPAEAKRLKPLL